MKGRLTRRSIAAAVLVSVTSAACGGSPSNESSPADPPASEPAEGAEGAAPDDGEAPAGTSATTPSPDADTAPEAQVDPPLEEPPPVVGEPAPDTQVVWPDDGCSADNSPTPAAAADGPAPVVAVRPGSADGPLPDLAVRRINCKGGWENLRNELPADRPLLVWFWAPH